MDRFYLTTPIYYANDAPHVGSSYTTIAADVLARYHRRLGQDTFFLTGTDEHGAKVAEAAAQRGISPKEFTDGIVDQFKAAWQSLDITNDYFVRTTDERHKAGVQAFLAHLHERGEIYKGKYEGLYCVGCEAFKAESEIVDGKCVLHPTRALEWVEERNWFFRLSRYRDFLRTLLTERREFIQPESRRNEILGLLEQGLDDVSASRSRFSWGVPFPIPLSTGESQTTYVWFDALPNYLTATGFPAAIHEGRWPAQLHVVGKDITRFHAVIWPAMRSL